MRSKTAKNNIWYNEIWFLCLFFNTLPCTLEVYSIRDIAWCCIFHLLAVPFFVFPVYSKTSLPRSPKKNKKPSTDSPLIVWDWADVCGLVSLNFTCLCLAKVSVHAPNETEGGLKQETLPKQAPLPAVWVSGSVMRFLQTDAQHRRNWSVLRLWEVMLTHQQTTKSQNHTHALHKRTTQTPQRPSCFGALRDLYALVCFSETSRLLCRK